MSKDRRRSRNDYDMTDEERRLRKFEPYRKVRKPIPPPSRFFKDKRHKRDNTIDADMLGLGGQRRLHADDEAFIDVVQEPAECGETDEATEH